MHNKDLATFRRNVLRMTQVFLADTTGEAENTIARRERGEKPILRDHIFALLGVHSVLNAGTTPDELYAAAEERLLSLIARSEK
jgi:hypothetical protein